MSRLLDTNICVSLLRGDDPAIATRLEAMDPRDLYLSSVVKAELLFGARKSHRPQTNLALLEAFFSQFDSIPFDDVAAEHYGRVRAAVEAKGTPVGASDLLIASIAMAHDLRVVTRNRREFSRIPGLAWESW